MPLPYFYEPTVENIPLFTVSEETSKHCAQVLRMKAGEQLQLTDGKGNLFIASIASADKKSTVVKIESHSHIAINNTKISIGISLVKNAARFEWFLEKATEIGITDIIPLLCKRTERQHFRYDRMNNILISAMLQSQQAWLPTLHEPTAIDKIIATAEFSTKLIAHCEEDRKTPLKEIVLSNNIQILIGPEGDFTNEEIKTALNNSYVPVTLGDTRLRTETAGMVAAALLRNREV